MSGRRRTPHEITWTSPAQRHMRGLPPKVVGVVVALVYGPLRDDPHVVGKPLGLELEGLHVARGGDYRVIYRINEKERTIHIVAVAHRADIYRPR